MINFLEEIKVIEITQNVGTFYIGKIKVKNLLKVANKNLSRYQDIQKGLQREISSDQLKSIKKYAQREYATFPNSIIIAVNYNDDAEPCWSFNEENSALKIRDAQDAVNIIDGQHRLFGLEGESELELPVSIFLGIPLAEQGSIFATINSNQRAVDASLVYELYGMSKIRREELVAYNIVSLLNEDKDSPWFDTIKMLGKAKNSGDISQGAFSKFIHKKLIDEKKVFRGLYEKGKDEIIYNIIYTYFSVISKTFPGFWKRTESNNSILTKTTGFNGFMLFLIDLAVLSKEMNLNLSTDLFEQKINSVKDKFKPFVNEYYPSGATGQNMIRDILRDSLTREEKAILNIK